MSTFDDLPSAYLPLSERLERYRATRPPRPPRDPDEDTDFSALRKKLAEYKATYGDDGPPRVYPPLRSVDSFDNVTDEDDLPPLYDKD